MLHCANGMELDRLRSVATVIPFNRRMNMSHIPNSAMPHAAPSETNQQNSDKSTQKTGLSAQAGKVAELARENPKTAIAAGAAVIAGIAAAAAIPLVRGRKSTDETGSASTKSKTSKEGA